jgi:hypothetical protein
MGRGFGPSLLSLRKEVIQLQFVAPKNPGYTLHCRDPIYRYFDDGRGRDITRPALVADFAEDAVTEEYQGAGEVMGVAGSFGSANFVGPRGGGFLDTEKAQARHGWTDAERKIVEEKLLTLCSNNPKAEMFDRMRDGFGDIQIYELPKVVPPLPNYEQLHHSSVAEFMEQAGMLEQALVYEQRREKQRPSVIAALEAKLALQRGEEALTAA